MSVVTGLKFGRFCCCAYASVSAGLAAADGSNVQCRGSAVHLAQSLSDSHSDGQLVLQELCPWHAAPVPVSVKDTLHQFLYLDTTYLFSLCVLLRSNKPPMWHSRLATWLRTTQLCCCNSSYWQYIVHCMCFCLCSITIDHVASQGNIC